MGANLVNAASSGTHRPTPGFVAYIQKAARRKKAREVGTECEFGALLLQAMSPLFQGAGVKLHYLGTRSRPTLKQVCFGVAERSRIGAVGPTEPDESSADSADRSGSSPGEESSAAAFLSRNRTSRRSIQRWNGTSGAEPRVRRFEERAPSSPPGRRSNVASTRYHPGGCRECSSLL